MSLNKLLDDNSDYRRSECSNGNNWDNPERCPAADDYRNKLNEFTKNAYQTSINDTVKTYKPLYESRVNNLDNKLIYPLVNYDFDYKTAAKLKYNPYTLNITNKPTIGNLLDAPVKYSQYATALLKDKFPSNDMYAGVSDIIKEDTERVNLSNKTQLLSSELPYPTFRKDYPECNYPTTGENSSSYFIRTGSCPTRIRTKQKCIDRGYSWIPNTNDTSDLNDHVKTKNKDYDESTGIKYSTPSDNGSCFKPRFSYIDNSSKGFLNNNGMIPSLLNDINSLSPDKIMSVLAGQTVEGSGQLPCVEDFNNYNSNSKNDWSFMIPLISILSGVLFIKLFIDKK